jgi:hypothetical protein
MSMFIHRAEQEGGWKSFFVLPTNVMLRPTPLQHVFNHMYLRSDNLSNPHLLKKKKKHGKREKICGLY